MSTKRVLITAVVLVAVVALGAEYVSRALFAPWSIGLFGRDTLIGSWTGSMQAKQGATFRLFLELNYKRRDASRRSHTSGTATNLEGRATLCAPTGERYDYAVSGAASPFGVVEQLWLEYGDPKLSALNLRLSGEWRAPSLHLKTDANPFLPDGRFVSTRSLSSDDPDNSFAPFDLARGTIDDRADCRPGRSK